MHLIQKFNLLQSGHYKFDGGNIIAAKQQVWATSQPFIVEMATCPLCQPSQAAAAAAAAGGGGV